MLLLTAKIAYSIVIVLHAYFVVLEMALWKSRGPLLFGISKEFANQSASLASNQGLYNGFLILALLIGMFAANPYISDAFILYGLGCVIIAGFWGAYTVHKKIFFVQALPALVAFGLYLAVRVPPPAP